MKDNLEVLAEYLGVAVSEINPDQKITVADANMLMTIYAKQCKTRITELEAENERLNSFGFDE